MTRVKDKEHFDLIIVGAGAAGLSLLLALAHKRYKGRILIVEQRESFQNDRIWSFWKTSHIPDYISDKLNYKWNTWSIEADKICNEQRHPEYPYCSLPAETLQQLALNVIHKHPDYLLVFGQTVGEITCENNQWSIPLNHACVLANNVVDTRIDKILKNSANQGNRLCMHQCFYGFEVEVSRSDDISERTVLPLQNKVYLMHDIQIVKEGLEFVYILPFSSKKALVEFTGFYKYPVSAQYLKDKASKYVRTFLGDISLNIVRTEFACLPMQNVKNSRMETHYIFGGIAGGAMRAASGYSFASIQKWANELSKQMIKYDAIKPYDPISPWYRWMDNIFLSAILNDTALSKTIFLSLSKKVKAGTFARFMSSEANLRDLLAIILAMPLWPFIKAMFRVIVHSK
uniref:lycopene cyclase family protein n=1 Tax=Ningiella ruwaisensis TaxID=2364274 RepID=UPI00109F2AF9|nr:lycopene cyclase family protein [Ningiella ruwaisensis]